MSLPKEKADLPDVLRIPLFGFGLGLAIGEEGQVDRGRMGGEIRVFPYIFSEKVPGVGLWLLSLVISLSQGHPASNFFCHSFDLASTGLGNGNSSIPVTGSGFLQVSSLLLPNTAANKHSSKLPSVCYWDSCTKEGNESRDEFCRQCFGEEGEKTATNDAANTAYKFSLRGLQY